MSKERRSDTPPAHLKPADVRILHVAETVTGGVATYLSEIVPYQVERFGAGNLCVLVPEEQRAELSGVDPSVLRTFRRSGRNPGSLLRLAAAFVATARRFDPAIVHIHSSFAGMVARLLAKHAAPRAKIVYCAHGWSFLMDVPKVHRRLYAVIEQALSRLTDVIVTISPTEQREAVRAGLPERRCVMIENAVADMAIPRTKPPRREPGPVRLLFVGRFDRQKGIDLLLRAMRLMEDAPVTLTTIGGSVRDAFSDEPPANVRVLDWRPRAELYAHYCAADALVVPSRWEGFGLVAAEAMSCGTPVIASDRGALPDVVVDGETGYIFHLDETDVSGLARLLRGLDPDRLAQMAGAARQHAVERFAVDRLRRRIVDLYTSLLAEREDRPLDGPPHSQRQTQNR